MLWSCFFSVEAVGGDFPQKSWSWNHNIRWSYDRHFLHYYGSRIWHIKFHGIHCLWSSYTKCKKITLWILSQDSVWRRFLHKMSYTIFFLLSSVRRTLVQKAKGRERLHLLHPHLPPSLWILMILQQLLFPFPISAALKFPPQSPVPEHHNCPRSLMTLWSCRQQKFLVVKRHQNLHPCAMPLHPEVLRPPAAAPRQTAWLCRIPAPSSAAALTTQMLTLSRPVPAAAPAARPVGLCRSSSQ